jgi:proline iminopeptidase
MLRSLVGTTLAFALAGFASAQSLVEGIVDRPDVKLHYTVHGDKGPYLVILSGGPGGSTRLMQPFADHLKDRFRCVMLDQRGVGQSKLDRYDDKTISFDAYIGDLEALREHLKQEKILVLGNSWGMTLGFAYAAAHPDKVAGLATVGSGHLSLEQEKAWQANLSVRLTEDQKRKVGEIGHPDKEGDEGYLRWFKIIVPAYFYNQEIASRFASGLKTGDLNSRIAVPAAHMKRRIDEYLLERLSRITCPVLLIQGRQDLAPEETAFLVKERVKGSKIVLFNECGHVPWLDRPEDTWDTLDEFLAQFK